jgi:hypothetical protein
MSVEYILGTQKGLIEAPAGCGKTQLIVDSLKTVTTKKPVLILTHTTAGVAAIRQRMSKEGIPGTVAIVSTIDGWSTRLSVYFPTLMAMCDTTPEINKGYYPFLRKQAGTLISNNTAVQSAISNSYSRIMVDEYQDCDVDQHYLVSCLATFLPTIVFGDPLQAIFTFSSPMPSWNEQVYGVFGAPGVTLSTPHRWLNAGAGDLGYWLLQTRQTLLQGRSVDLNTSLAQVRVIPIEKDQRLNLSNQQKLQYALHTTSPNESVLIIGDSKKPASHHQFAKGANNLDVVERVDLPDVVRHCDSLDKLQGIDLVESFINFHATLMTGVDAANTIKRVGSIANGRSHKPPSDKEASLVGLLSNSGASDLFSASKVISSCAGTHIYRKTAYKAFQEALSSAVSNGMTLKDSIIQVREKNRYTGDKRISHRAVGSTLLLKGLECDHCVILDAASLSLENFYVAVTRGAKSLSIYSNTKTLSW